MITLELTNKQAIALTMALTRAQNDTLGTIYLQLLRQRELEKVKRKLPNYKSDIRDYDLMYIRQTDAGLCVRLDEDHELFWLPKSKIQYEDRDYRRHETIKVTVPEWLAARHNLI